MKSLAGRLAAGRSTWVWDLATAAFVAGLLYPLAGLLAPVGRWSWDGGLPGSTLGAIGVSLGLNGLALLLIVALGTPVAWHLARHDSPVRSIWEAAILISVLMPPIALGILLSLAFGPTAAIGGALLRLGIPTSNSAPAFVVTQTYVGLGYYVLAARGAIAAVPVQLEKTAGLLGMRPWHVFWRVTFPLCRLGLAVAVSLAWVRTLGEFGAILVTSYHPSGMPVQMWIDLQDSGLPAVMPLLVCFLLTALPLPWLIHLFARRRIGDVRA